MNDQNIQSDKRSQLQEFVKCKSCKETLPRSAFYGADRPRTSGNYSRCKECERERGRNRRRSSTNPHVNAAKGAKRRAAGVIDSAELALLRIVDGKRCLKCGSTDKLRWDHVTPVAHGGLSEWDNFQTLCEPCNASKGASFADYRKVLT